MIERIRLRVYYQGAQTGRVSTEGEGLLSWPDARNPQVSGGYRSCAQVRSPQASPRLRRLPAEHVRREGDQGGPPSNPPPAHSPDHPSDPILDWAAGSRKTPKISEVRGTRSGENLYPGAKALGDQGVRMPPTPGS